MKRLIPNVVWFVSVFVMFSVVGYFGPESTEYVTYQWDYAFCCGFLCTFLTYGIGTLCAHWVDKIKGLR